MKYLSELSKKKLGQYIRKASKNAAKHAIKGTLADNDAEYDKGTKHFDKKHRRLFGIEKASRKMEEEFKVGDRIHLGFGAKGGAGFKGKILNINGDEVHIKHDSGKEYKGPLRFASKMNEEYISERLENNADKLHLQIMKYASSEHGAELYDSNGNIVGEIKVGPRKKVFIQKGAGRGVMIHSSHGSEAQFFTNHSDAKSYLDDMMVKYKRQPDDYIVYESLLEKIQRILFKG